MADKTVAEYSRADNADIKVKYKDMGDGTYARSLVATDTLTDFVKIDVYDRSDNVSISEKYLLTADGNYARSLVAG